MVETTVGALVAHIQEVVDAHDALIARAVFPDRIHAEDDETDPGVVRWELSVKHLCDLFEILELERVERRLSEPRSPQKED